MVVTKLLVKDNIPINRLIKSDQFQYMFKSCFKRIVKSHHEAGNILNTASNSLISWYKPILKDFLVSLTADEWSSKAAKLYLDINCHFIINNQQKKLCLGLIEIERGTAEKIQAEILLIQKTYGFIIVAITTDAASSITKAVKLSKTMHQKCYLHAINIWVIKTFFTTKKVINPLNEKKR